MTETSIIAGAYNIGNCFSFERSINSILSQTYTDFEFIICDDGSDDDTWALLTAFAGKDPRIRLIRNERNLGLAASLDRCIDISRGKFIARHDCDDYSAPDRLEKQIAYLKAHSEVALLGCNAYLFDQNGVWGRETFPENVGSRDFLFRSPYKHGSVVFRREALLKAGCYRVARETYRVEDYDLFMRMQEFCRGENLSDFLYYFCEDKNAKKRRKYRYRIDEAKIRLKGFKGLGLMPGALPYVVKPLVVGLIPGALLDLMKDRHYGRKL